MMPTAMSLAGPAFFIFQSGLGLLAADVIDHKKRLTALERLGVSLALGLGISALVLLTFLLLSRSWGIALPLTWLTIATAGILGFRRLWQSNARPRLGTLTRARLLTLGAVLTILLLWLLVLRSAWRLDGEGLPGAAALGWGDAAYHKAMIERLRVAAPFGLEHPVLSGTALNYPFLINLTSALYTRLGFSETLAWHLPLGVFASAVLGLLFSWGKRLSLRPCIAVALVLLVLFGSGLGFLTYGKDLAAAFKAGGAAGLLQALVKPPREYTNSHGAGNPPTVWIVPLLSFFAHQRSFVAGAALALALFLVVSAYRDETASCRWGIIWGLLPLWHAHTFLASTLVLLAWVAVRHVPLRSWLGGHLVGAALALPQVLILSPVDTATSFLSLKVGWLTDGHALWFWTKNFGVLFWLWVASSLVFALTFLSGEESWAARRRELAPFFAASVLVFVVANFIQFQPWAFDNNKVLFYWWLMAAAGVLVGAAHLSRSFPWSAYLLPLVVIASVLSGFVDVERRLTTEDPSGYYSTEASAVAAWVRNEAGPNERFLTASAPPPSLTMLTGRPLYLGYQGWLWSQGYGTIAHVRQERIRAFLTSGNAEALCREGVRYVLWNRELQREYPEADDKKVRAAAETLYASDGSEILKITCPQFLDFGNPE